MKDERKTKAQLIEELKELRKLVMTTDVSGLRQSHERAQHLNRVLRAIRDVNQLIVSEKDRDVLIQRACDILIETRGYQHAWIALADESRVVRSMAQAGIESGFSSLKRRMEAGDLPVCCRSALDLGEVFVTHDPLSFCDDCPLSSGHGGGTSGVAVRIEHSDKLFGAVGLAVPSLHAKDPEELSLIQELAGDLGLALSGLQIEEEQRRTVQELRESEEKYRTMLTNLEEGFYNASADGLLLDHNVAFNRILGLDPEEDLVGTRLPDFWQDPADRKPYLEELTRKGSIKGYLIKAKKRGGEKILVQATSRMVKDERGQPSRIEGTFLDVTDVWQAEEAQHESEELLAVTLRSIGDAVISTDSDGCVTFMNPTAETATGWVLSDASGRKLEEIFDIRSEDTGRSVESPIERVFREGVVVGLANHTKLIRRDGSELPIADSGAPIRDESGAIIGAVLVFQDITERRRAENDLRESEERFRSFFANAPIGKCITAPDGTLLQVNPAFSQMLGYSQEEMSRVPFASITHPDDVAESRECVRCLLAGERDTYTMEKRYLHKADHPVWTHVTTRLLRDDAGNPVHFLTHILDINKARKAQQALAKSEARFRLVAESLSDVVYEWDLGTCIEWIGNVDELMGHGPGEFPRTLDGWASLIHPEDIDRVMTAIDRQLKDAVPYTVEYRVRRKDDNYSTWSARGTVLRDAEEQPRRWIGAITDITMHRKAESDLSLKNQVFEDSIAALSIANISGMITEVNPAFLALWRYDSKEDAIGGSVGDFFVDEADAGPVLEALGTSGRWEGDFRARRTDGTTFISRGLATAMKNERGDLIGYQSANLDVTEQRRAEDEIKLRNQISSIFLSVPDDEMYTEVLKVVLDAAQSEFGVFGYIDEDGALIVPSMTRHIWDECQVPEKDIVFPQDKWGDSIWPRAIRQKRLLFSNSPSDLAPQGHIPITRNIAAPIVHQGAVVGLLQVANKASDYTPDDIRIIETLRDTVAPILSARLARDQQERDRRRREEDIVALNKDLDERVVARTIELTAANKELEAFAYSVSHDLRAPLRGIDGFSKALLEDYQDLLDDTGKDYINRVRAGTQRMGTLIDDLLKLSRMTRSEMRHQHLDLGEMAIKIGAALRRDEPDRAVDLVIAPGLTAHGDRALMEAAVKNLLRNAWKFTGLRERARIELAVTEQDGERVYSIRDNGAGFDMAYADKLFGPFQRLHDTTEFPGTGIGLAIVHRVITRHGGRIWAEGEIGKGATFYFTLPTTLHPKAGERAES